MNERGTWARDSALRITDHAAIGDNEEVLKGLSGREALKHLLFKVEWDTRKDGTTPQGGFYQYQLLKKKCPQLVLDYIEDMVQF